MSATNDTQELRKREAWAQKRSMLYAQQVTELEARCAVLARALEDILAALPVMHITWEPGADDLVFVRAREALAAAPTREAEPSCGVTLTEEQAGFVSGVVQSAMSGTWARDRALALLRGEEPR